MKRGRISYYAYWITTVYLLVAVTWILLLLMGRHN
jgi:hypothetical protein